MWLRNDGEYTVYVIQVKTRSRWANADLNRFGRPHASFYASGQCWQVTGLTGTFDRHDAWEGLRVIRKRWPECEFRLVAVNVSQVTQPLEERT